MKYYVMLAIICMMTCTLQCAAPLGHVVDLPEGQAIHIKYSYIGCFSADGSSDMDIHISKVSGLWRFSVTTRERVTQKLQTVSFGIPKSEAGRLDSALSEKIYSKDDVQMSGSHCLDVTWSTGITQRIEKSGDDDRFLQFVLNHIPHPPQSNTNTPNKSL